MAAVQSRSTLLGLRKVELFKGIDTYSLCEIAAQCRWARCRRNDYVVRRGDSLSSIARRFRVSVDKLVEWNTGAGDKYLQPGQRLRMVVDVTEQSG